MTLENIERIVGTFASRAEEAHIFNLAGYDEITYNYYNLSVSKYYVMAEDTREKIYLMKLNAEIREIVASEQVLRDSIDAIIAKIEVR